MKTIKIIILYLYATLFISACKISNSSKIVQFVDSNGKHIGDSLFSNDKIVKIIYFDSTLYVDSVVFEYHDQDKLFLKSKQTYMNGHLVFENIDYYENGNIKFYKFIDEDNEKYYYKRFYNLSGKMIQEYGELFFQGFIKNLDETFDFKLGDTIEYSIFYPNPPDCETNLYIMIDNEPHYIFSKNEYVNCLQTVKACFSNIGYNKTDVWLSIKENYNDSVLYYNKPLYIEVSK